MTTDTLINDEILKNGNTNLITNSGLASGSQIFAIGDSHTIFFYNSMKIKEHWGFGGKIPLTIYTMLRDGINIYEIGNILGNNHQHYNIKDKDYVIFYYGFNDIQRSINIHLKDNWEQGITYLFSNYINYIKTLSIKYNITPIIPCIYPNPRPEAQGQNPSGTYMERIQYTKHANKILKTTCEINNISFLDIYDYITDEKGFIKKDMTSDNIHLDYNNTDIRNFIEREIYKFCC